jgi:hypothetical protein
MEHETRAPVIIGSFGLCSPIELMFTDWLGIVPIDGLNRIIMELLVVALHS